MTFDGDRGRWSRRDAWMGAILLLFGAALPLALRAALGLSHPAGSDPDLWGLYALNVPLGTPCAVPPAFPSAVYLIHLCTGLMPVPAAALAAWGAATLVGPLAYVLARWLGARPMLAAAGAALALTTPHASTLTVQAQPDTAVMALLLAAALAVLAVHRWPGAAGSLALAAVAGTAPLWREHGLVVTAVALCAAIVIRGTPLWRSARVALIVLLLLVSPSLLGQGFAPPWSQPWFARVSLVGEELEAAELPEHARMLRGAERERVAGYYRDGARVRLALYHGQRALRLAPVEWTFALAAGLLALLAGRRRRVLAIAPLVGLVPVLPALLIWSGPRHVAVALPVALTVCAAGISAFPVRARWAAGLAVLVVWAASHLAWPGVSTEIRSQAEGMRDLEDVGTDLCRLAEPGDLASGDLRAFLYCPLPLATLGDPTTDWRIWRVTREPEEREGWVHIPTRCPRFVIHRYHAEFAGAERPCNESFPPPDTPFIALQPRPVPLAPPCAPPASWLAELPPAPATLEIDPKPVEEIPRPARSEGELDERERRARARPRVRLDR
ncbi:MAG: hypothetical protein QGH45_22585 [Myxococcota bacterium]|nr:hypothetical protein [Myxococcota bacterium]